MKRAVAVRKVDNSDRVFCSFHAGLDDFYSETLTPMEQTHEETGKP